MCQQSAVLTPLAWGVQTTQQVLANLSAHRCECRQRTCDQVHGWSPKCTSPQTDLTSLLLLATLVPFKTPEHVETILFGLGSLNSWNSKQVYKILSDTSSTAQGGGGSFKNRKPIGEVGCCESGMAKRIHWWTERCLRSPLCLSLSLTIYLPIYLLCIYLSSYLSLSFSLSSNYLSTYLPIYLSIYLSI